MNRPRYQAYGLVSRCIEAGIYTIVLCPTSHHIQPSWSALVLSRGAIFNVYYLDTKSCARTAPDDIPARAGNSRAADFPSETTAQGRVGEWEKSSHGATKGCGEVGKGLAV